MPKDEQPTMLEQPPGLDERAQELWDTIGRQLLEDGILESLDASVLAAWCRTESRKEQLAALVAEEGEIADSPRSGLKRHPATTLLREAEELSVKLRRELGLSPLARLRVKQKRSNRYNEFSKFSKWADV